MAVKRVLKKLRMLSKRRTELSILLLVLVISGVRAQAEPLGAEAGQRPVVFLGNDSLPPLNFLQGGKPAGIVVDLARAIAQRMPSRVDIRLMPWAEAQQLVSEGRADALLQINASPERLRTYDFSEPLLTSDFAIFILAGRMGIAGKNDLRGLRVGTEEKGHPYLLLRQDPAIDVRTVADIGQGFRMLATGAVDAVVADRWVGGYVLAEYRIEGVRAVVEPIERSHSAIAVKKGNTKLLRQVNAALADIRSDGTYDRIVESWRPKEVVFVTHEQMHRHTWLTAALAAALVAALAGVAAMLWEVRRRRRAEETLRESEARFRLTFDQSPVGKIIIDRNFLTLRVNNALCQFLGYSAEEMKTKTFADFTHPDDLPRELEAGRALQSENGVALALDKRYIRKDGQVVWGHLVVDAVRDLAGKPLYFVGLVQDITERKRTEEALFRSRQTFKALADNAPDIIARYDRQYRHLFVSPRVEKVTGLTVADYIGKTNEDLGMPRDLCEKWNSLIEATFVLGKEQKGEFVFPSDAGPVSYDIRLVPEFAPDGSVETVLSVARDITDRKKAERVVRESEERLRLAQDVAGIGIWEWNPKSGKTIWSPEIEKIHGVEPGSLKDFAAWRKLVHPEDLARVETETAEAITQRRRFDMEFRIIRPSGELRWVTTLGGAIYDDSGEVIRAFGVNMDITERKRVEETLRESEERFRLMGDTIPYGAWMADAEGRNTYISPLFLELVGRTFEQVKEFGWTDKLLPEDVEPTMRRWMECIRTGRDWEGELRFPSPDGRWHTILSRGKPLRDAQGQVKAWVGINLDITARKQAEEALQASLREKEVLLKEIHHRVKNNMQVLSSLVSLQADALVNLHSSLGRTSGQSTMTTDDSARQALRGAFDDLRDQVRTMALVHEKLYQSQSLEKVDFAEYARALLDYIWRVYGEKAAGIRLTLDTQPVTFSVQAAVPCGLILNELTTNALKHAYLGRTDGELTVTLRAKPDGDVCLCVSDNGVGLPAGFDWRQSRSLGLQLVQMLVGQLGGTLDVHHDRGTTIQITFKPVKQGDEHG